MEYKLAKQLSELIRLNYKVLSEIVGENYRLASQFIVDYSSIDDVIRLSKFCNDYLIDNNSTEEKGYLFINIPGSEMFASLHAYSYDKLNNTLNVQYVLGKSAINWSKADFDFIDKYFKKHFINISIYEVEDIGMSYYDKPNDIVGYASRDF